MLAYKMKIEGMPVTLSLNEDLSGLVDGDKDVSGVVVAGVGHGELPSMRSHFYWGAKAALEDRTPSRVKVLLGFDGDGGVIFSDCTEGKLLEDFSGYYLLFVRIYLSGVLSCFSSYLISTQKYLEQRCGFLGAIVLVWM